jgi:hypothetical protein
MRLFVVNVGVNSADAGRYRLRSPIFQDGTFESVPIKESSEFASAPGVPSYRTLRAFNPPGTETLARFVPEKVADYAVHADPEFDTHTYGDVDSPKGAALRTAAPGDQLWFLARLWGHDRVRWTGESDFYLVAHLTVLRNVFVVSGVGADDLADEVRAMIRENAHYKRLLLGSRKAFRVIVGDAARSRRFRRAIRVTPKLAGHIYGGIYDGRDGLYRCNGRVLVAKNGKPRRFETFGSATRTVQSFLDSNRPSDLEHLEALRKLAETAC